MKQPLLHRGRALRSSTQVSPPSACTHSYQISRAIVTDGLYSWSFTPPTCPQDFSAPNQCTGHSPGLAQVGEC